MQAGVLILPRVQTQDTQAGAVIQRGVLKDGVPPQFDDLDIDLHGVTGLLLLEQTQLAWASPRLRPQQPWSTERQEGALNRRDTDTHAMHACQPHPRAWCAPLMFEASRTDQHKYLGTDPPLSLCGIPRHQSGRAL